MRTWIKTISRITNKIHTHEIRQYITVRYRSDRSLQLTQSLTVLYGTINDFSWYEHRMNLHQSQSTTSSPASHDHLHFAEVVQLVDNTFRGSWRLGRVILLIFAAQLSDDVMTDFDAIVPVELQTNHGTCEKTWDYLKITNLSVSSCAIIIIFILGLSLCTT